MVEIIKNLERQPISHYKDITFLFLFCFSSPIYLSPHLFAKQVHKSKRNYYSKLLRRSYSYEKSRAFSFRYFYLFFLALWQYDNKKERERKKKGGSTFVFYKISFFIFIDRSMIDLKSVSRGCMKFATLEQNRKSWWKKNQHPKIRICEERARVITSVKRKLAKLLFETCEGLFFFNINIIFRFTPSYDMINYSLEAIDKFYYFFFFNISIWNIETAFSFFFWLQIARGWRLFRRARLRRAKSVAIENAMLRYHGWRRKKNRVKRIHSTWDPHWKVLIALIDDVLCF